jgi:DmsE family decaheme c-type cytochrome
MRFKSIVAATGLLAAIAAFMALPAFGQATQYAPVCANCHEQAQKSTDLTPHGAKNDANGSMCQACHGDASAHMKDPTKVKPQNALNTKGATAAAKDAVCQTCHAGNRHLVFWESGKHAKNEVSCTSCHNIHGKQGKVAVSPFVTSTRPNEADMCGACHQQIRAATLKPSHHPIVENKIKCSDCHNVHGALTPAMLKSETVNQQCYSCHADKRGPYIFAHAAVEENCLSCHNPHGSVYAKLLNEKVPNLCQDCHDAARHPGTIYGAAGEFNCPDGATTDPTNVACYNKQPGTFNRSVSTRLIARSCLNCHNAIHGSNAPGARGKYFIR